MVMPYLPAPSPSRLSTASGPVDGLVVAHPLRTRVSSWLKIETAVFVLNTPLRGAAPVLVVHEQLVGRGQPGLEVPRVEHEAHSGTGLLQRLGVGDHLGERQRRGRRVEARLRGTCSGCRTRSARTRRRAWPTARRSPASRRADAGENRSSSTSPRSCRTEPGGTTGCRWPEIRWSSSWTTSGSWPFVRPAVYFCQVSS